MKTSICFQCKCQALCPTGQVQPREATVSAITACFRFQSKDKQTRADRVRGMTDEELAEWLDNNTYRFPIYKDWLDWLRQEAADADN